MNINENKENYINIFNVTSYSRELFEKKLLDFYLAFLLLAINPIFYIFTFALSFNSLIIGVISLVTLFLQFLSLQ